MTSHQDLDAYQAALLDQADDIEYRLLLIDDRLAAIQARIDALYGPPS